MLNWFRTSKKQHSRLPSLVYASTCEYWRATFLREEDFYRKEVANSDEELSKIYRQDWWANYPGVSSSVQSNLNAGLELAYAGEWELALKLIRGRCLPYQYILDSPEYHQRLQEEAGCFYKNSVGEFWAAMGFARSLVSESFDNVSLEKALAYYRQYLEEDQAAASGEWCHQYEYDAILAAMLGLIMADYAGVLAQLDALPPASLYADYMARLRALTEEPQSEKTRQAFLQHCLSVWNMENKPNKWISPPGFSDPEYRFVCGVLADRTLNNWEGVPNWRKVCERIATAEL